MKYIVLIPDGAADLPITELDGRTPLEAARTPNLAALASRGRVGCAHTTPPGFEAGSDVCSMSLLGYDPARYHTGRAPLEAAALGISPGPDDWIFRLNLVTTNADGTMVDHSAGAISDAEARTLVSDLMAMWRERVPSLVKGLTLTPGVSYRNILVDASGRSYAGVEATPPHEIPGEPWEDHLPFADGTSQEAATVLERLMRLSAEFLPSHHINLTRQHAGKRMATMAWIWGGGTRPSVPPFKDRYGARGAMITPVDLLAGIASYIGWDRLAVPGITSYHDTDYAAQGQATCDAIDRYDIVCCHVEAPDEASHQGDWKTKVASLEAIDEHIVAPILRKLESFGDPGTDATAGGWRILVMPDHYTLCSTRKHDATPVPFLMAGAWVRSAVSRGFTERDAIESDLNILAGHDLMEYFLHAGLVRSERVG